MSTRTWSARLHFEELDLHLSEIDVMADLDPYWIGWAAEAAATAALAAQADEVEPEVAA